MIEIPLQPVPSQSLNVTLSNQNVDLLIYSTERGMFINVTLNGEMVSTGVACFDLVPLVRNEYLGFVGNLIFMDTLGNENPAYTGLGDRWKLVYLDAIEYE